MAMQKTLGGDRLGSGKRMKVDLHGYERSTHDLGYLWRSTMSAGTLVPFMSELALPGDTFDINLDIDIKTLPTIGPLFGSYKIQLDVFQAPIRLYQGQLHNNKLGIGMNMANVKLPTITLTATEPPAGDENLIDWDNTQINPSCILAYLGIRGVGLITSGDPTATRDFNAVPFLAYWDIYKQYYSNKQEELGAVIHTEVFVAPVGVVTDIDVTTGPETGAIPLAPGQTSILTGNNTQIEITYVTTAPLAGEYILHTAQGDYIIDDLFYSRVDDTTDTITYSNFKWAQFGQLQIINYRQISQSDVPITPPGIRLFNLANIDQMREEILAFTTSGPTPFNINQEATAGLEPYFWPIEPTLDGQHYKLYPQEGLALKTYQSDLFNNWLSTEWIDGTGGISEVTAIDTSGGSFTIDTLQLSKKVYDMLNRIAVSGGTYDDWLDAVYTHDRVQRAESPIYHGGLIRELVFQEVVSNAEAAGNEGSQPLGTLAGKGVMGSKRKGGQVTIKVDEPSYIIGIVSLTPRVDYSQGNKWDVHLMTMDDLHKPALDEIGFQELITEQMAWWSTNQAVTAGPWITKSAGKQPAWINYMTNVNKTFGNFAINTKEMFMTLNRRYEFSAEGIDDLTTYIDPTKFNHIFAQASIDAQNFWTQIAVDITARRKMSAKIMPNL